jgi:hypothetical protein
MKHTKTFLSAAAFFLLLECACAAASASNTPPRKLSWAPPKLENPATINATDSNRILKLDQSKDYIIELPKDQPLRGGLSIWGGRNAVLIGGEILISADDPRGALSYIRAVYLQEHAGTMHFEGVLIRGENPGDLQEGFNLNLRQTNCVVQIQNVRVEKVHGTRDAHHADILQTWAGPAELRIDGLTGFTQYQGMFLLPNQHFPLEKGGFLPKKWIFKNINIEGAEGSGYMLWAPPSEQQWPMEIENVWVKPHESKQGRRDSFLWPKPDQESDRFWEDVKAGVPPGGDFVPAGTAGLNYISPGYADAAGEQVVKQNSTRNH